MKKTFEVTDRGFKIYGQLEDEHGALIVVNESSEVGRPRIWLSACGGELKNPKPYLNVEQAKNLIQILEDFVQDAEDKDNWRNDPEYKENWG